MQVTLGNAHAIEGYRPDPDDPKIVYRPINGEQITTFVLPDAMELDEAVSAIAVTMGAHIQPGEKPSWVESDNAALRIYLCAMWQLDPSHTRPETWGSPRHSDAEGAKLKQGTAKKKKAGPPAPMPSTEDDDS